MRKVKNSLNSRTRETWPNCEILKESRDRLLERTAVMEGLLTQLVGKESTRTDSWRISDLARPEVLVQAVQSAARADVVLVAVSAAGELPPDLCVWIDAWLPRRAGCTGALVAMIGVPEAASRPAARVQEYFQAVARKGQLGFFPNKRRLPAPSRVPFDREASAGEVGARTAAPAELGPARSAAPPKPEFEFAMPNGQEPTNRLVAGPRNGPGTKAVCL